MLNFDAFIISLIWFSPTLPNNHPAYLIYEPHQLIKTIKHTPDTVILQSQCQTPVNTENESANLDDQEALFPFKEALAGHFKINLLAPDNAKYQQIESAMSGIYNTVMPIAGVFLPPMTPEENRASSDRETKIAVASMFEKLMKDKNVVLFIDDFQWIG